MAKPGFEVDHLVFREVTPSRWKDLERLFESRGAPKYCCYGDWIRLLRRHGFEVEDLIEVRAPEGAATRDEFVTPHWARRWPSEEIWKARKRG